MNKWHPFYLLVVTGDGLYILDMAAKIDATADYICKAKWGDVEFPPPFGREAYPEVRCVLQLNFKLGLIKIGMYALYFVVQNQVFQKQPLLWFDR